MQVSDQVSPKGACSPEIARIIGGTKPLPTENIKAKVVKNLISVLCSFENY